MRYGSKINSDGSGVYVKAQKEGYKHERFVEMREPEKTHEHLKWVNIRCQSWRANARAGSPQ